MSLERNEFEETLQKMIKKYNIDPNNLNSIELLNKNKELVNAMSIDPIGIMYDQNNDHHREFMVILSLAATEAEAFKTAGQYIHIKGEKVLKFLSAMGENDVFIVSNVMARDITLYFKSGIKNKTLYKNLYKEISDSNITYEAKDVCIKLFPILPNKFEEICNLIMRSN